MILKSHQDVLQRRAFVIVEMQTYFGHYPAVSLADVNTISWCNPPMCACSDKPWLCPVGAEPAGDAAEDGDGQLPHEGQPVQPAAAAAAAAI